MFYQFFKEYSHFFLISPLAKFKKKLNKKNYDQNIQNAN